MEIFDKLYCMLNAVVCYMMTPCGSCENQKTVFFNVTAVNTPKLLLFSTLHRICFDRNLLCSGILYQLQHMLELPQSVIALKLGLLSKAPSDELDGRSSIPGRAGDIFLYSTASRLTLGPNQPPIEWIPRPLSAWVKRPERETDTFMQCRYQWCIYVSTPQN
jgi:hypothetical protein